MNDRQKEIEELIRNLVLKRLAQLSSDTGLSIGAEGNFTRDQLIQHVEAGDDIGKKIEEIQMAGLRFWKQEAGL